MPDVYHVESVGVNTSTHIYAVAHVEFYLQRRRVGGKEKYFKNFFDRKISVGKRTRTYFQTKCLLTHTHTHRGGRHDKMEKLCWMKIIQIIFPLPHVCVLGWGGEEGWVISIKTSNYEVRDLQIHPISLAEETQKLFSFFNIWCSFQSRTLAWCLSFEMLI